MRPNQTWNRAHTPDPHEHLNPTGIQPRIGQALAAGCAAVRINACRYFIALVALSNFALADDSTSKIREGIRLYSAEQFEDASKSFAAATESLEKQKSEKSATSAFDEACALHRKGDLELARERYLKAGLSQEKSIATSAHFNLGVLASEQARKIAGDDPEKVTAEQRQEILAELSKSIDSYRHCLEIQPQYVPARRNLELLRQWIKYYTDRWRELDLQKRRDETNLIQFLEYLMQAQLALKETAQLFGANTSPNTYAELKRVQDELSNEIPYLKDKIETELRPPEQDPSNATAPNATATTKSAPSQANQEELERGIALLNGWADEAALKMAGAGKDLNKREAKLAADKQGSATDKLDQIWDAVIPFHPLLGKELLEQTQISKQLEKADPDPDPESESTALESSALDSKLKVTSDDFSKLLEQQEKALRKTRLLGPKAESELAQVESQPIPEQTADPSEPIDGETTPNAQPKPDPEAIKAGYRKAIELAPKAVEEMDSAVKKLAKKARSEAVVHTEEARRILQEIQDAQPKNPEQDKQDKQDQNKDQNQEQDKDQKKESDPKQDKDQDKEKKDGENQDPNDEQKKPDEKKEDSKENKEKSDKEDKEKKPEQGKEPKISKDRMEEALRRVRERQQEIRDRNKELKARVLGRVPVDKDW